MGDTNQQSFKNVPEYKECCPTPDLGKAKTVANNLPQAPMSGSMKRPGEMADAKK